MTFRSIGRLLLLVAALVLLAGGCAKSQPWTATAETLYLDVRTRSEFAGGHVPNASNVPVDEIGGAAALIGAKDRHVVVYCRSGSRAGTAQAALQALGFTNVVNGGSAGAVADKLGVPLTAPE